MYGYVYMTENLINGKKYIGKHKCNFFDPNYKGSGTYLRRSMKKYGKDNFKTIMLESAKNLSDLNKLEIFYIEKFNCVDSENFYNIARGGDGGETLSPQQIEDLKNKPNPMLGRKHSDETKEKISKANKSRGKNIPLTDEHKQKISQSNKGKNKGKPSYWSGKSLSLETREKISKSKKGKVSPRKDAELTEETKMKISESRKGKYVKEKHPLAKKCILKFIDGTVIQFNCLVDLFDFMKDDLSTTTIKKILREGVPYKTKTKTKLHLNGMLIYYI